MLRRKYTRTRYSSLGGRAPGSGLLARMTAAIHEWSLPVILFLPFSLPDATPIGDSYAMQTRDGFTYYFFNLQPFDCHPADDRRAMLLRAARLHVVSGVRQADIMCAFDISRPTVARAVKRYRERGEDAFFEPRRGAWAYRRRRSDGRPGGQTARFRDQRQRLRSATRHSGEHLPRKPSRWASSLPPPRHLPPSRTLRRRLRSPISPPTRTLRRRLRSPITPPTRTLRRRLRPPITPPARTLHRPTRLRLPIVPPATPATSKRPWAARLAMSRAACSPAPA